MIDTQLVVRYHYFYYSFASSRHNIFTYDPYIQNVYHITWDYQYFIFFEWSKYVFFLTKIDLSIRSSRNLLAAKTFLNNYCLSSKLFAYDKYVMLIHKCSFDVFYDGFFLPHILSIYCWQASKCNRNNQDWYFHLW